MSWTGWFFGTGRHPPFTVSQRAGLGGCCLGVYAPRVYVQLRYAFDYFSHVGPQDIRFAL